MFRRSRQADDESILSYVTLLLKLVSTWGYEDQEDDNIRDLKNDNKPMKYACFRCSRISHVAKGCHQKDKTGYKCGRVV